MVKTEIVNSVECIINYIVYNVYILPILYNIVYYIQTTELFRYPYSIAANSIRALGAGVSV